MGRNKKYKRIAKRIMGTCMQHPKTCFSGCKMQKECYALSDKRTSKGDYIYIVSSKNLRFAEQTIKGGLNYEDVDRRV